MKPNKKWKPKVGERVCVIYFHAKLPWRANWINFGEYMEDYNQLKMGNVFRTKKEAQEKLREIKRVLKA